MELAKQEEEEKRKKAEAELEAMRAKQGLKGGPSRASKKKAVKTIVIPKYDDSSDDYVHCPLCAQMVLIPDMRRGSASLPLNIFVRDLIERGILESGGKSGSSKFKCMSEHRVSVSARAPMTAHFVIGVVGVVVRILLAAQPSCSKCMNSADWRCQKCQTLFCNNHFDTHKEVCCAS